MIKYFRPRYKSDLVKHLDGYLIHSANDYRIPLMQSAQVESDINILCDSQFYVQVGPTKHQLEKGVNCHFLAEPLDYMSKISYYVIPKPIIHNNQKREHLTNNGSLFIKKR